MKYEQKEEMHMKFFEEPIVEVQKFAVEDVITTSGDTDPGNKLPADRG